MEPPSFTFRASGPGRLDSLGRGAVFLERVRSGGPPARRAWGFRAQAGARGSLAGMCLSPWGPRILDQRIILGSFFYRAMGGGLGFQVAGAQGRRGCQAVIQR